MTRARIDRNQSEIVRALRQAGASVQSLAEIGQGCPDILVGFRQKNWVLEIKDGMAPPSAQKLTEDEKRWHQGWSGEVYLVKSVQEALKVISQ